MCGRTACCQCRETYQKATSYYSKDLDKYVQPAWQDESNCGLTFIPSTNIAPTEVTPVLVSGKYCSETTTDQVLKPMMWGLIPPWHKGDFKSHGLSTNNCRIEGLNSSKMYSPLLRKGNRCVVICDGFYEWQTTKGKTKQPYFIYSPQDPGVKVEDKLSWIQAEWNERTGWQGPKPLYMAGLYGVWESPTEQTMYSYSVITLESNDSFSWLHHRVPAILPSLEDVQSWLDIDNVSAHDSLNLLNPPKTLASHPVSTLVNNSRNKDPSCNQPAEPKKPSASSLFMKSWLKRSSDKAEGESSADKKLKLEK